MRWIVMPVAVLAFAHPALANDWEKYFHPSPSNLSVIAYDKDPEVINSSGNVDGDVESMWRKGYAPVGYSAFSTGNNKTADAVRFAKKLNARFVIVRTNLTSSRTVNMPLTVPTQQTSFSNGNVSATGSGGYASGTYSGTTTTYGTQTTMIPIMVNRFEKMAIYFKEAPKTGFGISTRELTPAEIAQLETRRAVAIRYIRDGSPAYNADLLPGDIILKLNGAPIDGTSILAATKGSQPIHVTVIRNGHEKLIDVTVPPEWQPKP